MPSPLALLRQLAAILAISGAGFAGTQQVDRMVAVVDRRVITQSEWWAEESFVAFIEGKGQQAILLDQASLDRLIDRELILQQIQNVNFTRATPEEIGKQVHTLRQQASALDDAAWSTKLSEYGLDAEEFNDFVGQQMDVLHFIENRFRSNARVAPDKVQTYYQQTFIPELLKAGTAPQSVPPLRQVQDKITQVLVEQRVDEMLAAWLESLRNQARIRRVLDLGGSGSAAKNLHGLEDR